MPKTWPPERGRTWVYGWWPPDWMRPIHHQWLRLHDTRNQLLPSLVSMVIFFFFLNKLSESITVQYLFPNIFLHHWIVSSFENKSCGILAEYLAHVCTLNYGIVPGDIAVLRLMCIFFFQRILLFKYIINIAWVDRIWKLKSLSATQILHRLSNVYLNGGPFPR